MLAPRSLQPTAVIRRKPTFQLSKPVSLVLMLIDILGLRNNKLR
jgi:hypothetical protein